MKPISPAEEGPDSPGRPLIGRRLRSVEKIDYTWFFRFDAGVSVATTETPWRLIVDGRIVTSSDDHAQWFGRSAPVDAAREAFSRAGGLPVEAAFVATDTGDLTIQFPGEIDLQFLQLSSGYDAWHLRADRGESLCTGGGSVEYIPES